MLQAEQNKSLHYLKPHRFPTREGLRLRTSSLSFLTLIVLQGIPLLSTYGCIYFKTCSRGFYHPSDDKQQKDEEEELVGDNDDGGACSTLLLLVASGP